MTTAADTHSRLPNLAKAEGSRGGHIIGHTKSGKAIYSRGSSINAVMRKLMRSEPDGWSARKAHPGYSAADHEEAAAAHGRNADMSIGDDVRAHEGLERAHLSAAWDLRAKTRKSSAADASLDELTALAKAEGSRGGHIIGHSKSGRPIYEAKGTKRELLHKLDHGLNHVAVASSLKHKHYIGMTSQDHFARAAKHQAQAVKKFKSARKAGSVKDAVGAHRAGQAHMSLSRAHAMMGQLSADVRTPDHIREAASMHNFKSHDKTKLAATKDRYFSTLGKVGHQRAISRHVKKRDAARDAGHQATYDHHEMMANAHQAVLHSVYGDNKDKSEA